MTVTSTPTAAGAEPFVALSSDPPPAVRQGQAAPAAVDRPADRDAAGRAGLAVPLRARGLRPGDGLLCARRGRHSH